MAFIKAQNFALNLETFSQITSAAVWIQIQRFHSTFNLKVENQLGVDKEQKITLISDFNSNKIDLSSLTHQVEVQSSSVFFLKTQVTIKNAFQIYNGGNWINQALSNLLRRIQSSNFNFVGQYFFNQVEN
ncbi:unnamed protein product (macronuclear) [Paramecium tetraurelia]|uniref:Lipid-binding serum glycoprotein N-terminal domain-containing protein n=1 Tax=Paramecium tetraurelia TaxID=5888 RepID=A0BJW4_PARTE|nr:uncharacterized protein GSPATT00029461001 [Paramecium tetraurelia]CAK58831.1 unnamed protein product [Paramecium tetraurelia]|eukprot:XP_001426229.1 hypothetical protein (macronuclear) [Paramecium tetraurelia strain d4-2]